MKERVKDLPRGHPSSPYYADGSPQALASGIAALRQFSDLAESAEADLTPYPSRPIHEDGHTTDDQATEAAHPETKMSDADYAAHIQEVETALEQAYKEGLTTENLHRLDQDADSWEPERRSAHDEIIRDIYAAAAHVPCDRKAIIAGGLAGAGKTTTLEQHAGLDLTNYLTINPDNFKEELAKRGMTPQIPGLSPMETSGLAHEESSYLAKRLALLVMADGKNIVWDITMSDPDKTAGRITELRRASYREIDGIFVDIPPDVSIARSQERNRRGHDSYLVGHGYGGRYPLPELTRAQADSEYGTLNRRAFETVKHQFDRWSVYDNSVDGRPPVLIDSSDHPTWTDFPKEPRS